METIQTISELKAAIQVLEVEQSKQLILLKQEFSGVCERLKPINIIKDTLGEANLAASNLKTKVINNILGASTGMIAKKIILGKTNNLATKLLGGIIELFVSKNIANHVDEIKSFTGNLLKK